MAWITKIIRQTLVSLQNYPKKIHMHHEKHSLIFLPPLVQPQQLIYSHLSHRRITVRSQTRKQSQTHTHIGARERTVTGSAPKHDCPTFADSEPGLRQQKNTSKPSPITLITTKRSRNHRLRIFASHYLISSFDEEGGA